MPVRGPDLARLLAAVNDQRDALGEAPFHGPLTERTLGAASLAAVLAARANGAEPQRAALRAAVRYSLGPQSGQSQGDLVALDRDLGTWIAIDQTNGDANLATGARALYGWQWIPVVVWVLIGGLAYLGIRPRLKEYPSMVSIIATRLSTR